MCHRVLRCLWRGAVRSELKRQACLLSFRIEINSQETYMDRSESYSAVRTSRTAPSLWGAKIVRITSIC